MASTFTGDDLYSGLIARGFGPAQAAALAGNAQQESSFNSQAWNAPYGAGGLWQWRGPRLQALEAFAQQQGKAVGDPDVQMDFLKQEMNGPEAGNSKAFLSAQDVPSANAALKGYLRYGDNESGNRLGYSMAFAGKQPTQQGDPSGALDAIFGPDQPAESSAAPNATPAAAQPDPATSQALESIFGPDASSGLPPVGTPAYVKAIAERMKEGKPVPQPATPPPGIATPPDVIPDWLRAFTSHTVESIPVAGAGARAARNTLIGPGAEAQMEGIEQQASNTAPAAAVAGNVFGAVAPLALAGTTGIGARLLGMSGGLPARIGMGALSSGAISGADTAARGGTTQQVTQNALTGAAVGGALPIAGKAIGAGWNAFMGPTGETMVANAMKADQNAPSQVNQLLTARGPGATVADLGPNTQSLAAGIASLPGEAQGIVVNNLKARAADTGARLAQDVSGTIGQGQPIGALTDQIVAQQKAAAAPLYAAVRGQPVQPTASLNAIAATPLGKQAFQQAATMMQNDGLRPNSTVALYDYAKQALDDIAEQAQRTGANNQARQATQMAASLRGEVDAQVPAYAQARDAFAGPAKVLDAVQQGQKVFSSATSPEDLQTAWNSMSSSERDGLLAGAQAAVQKAIGSARTDAAGVKSLFDSNYGKEKLAILVGQPQADQITNALERERVFSDTSGRVTRNSMTASNLAQQKAVNPDLAVPNKLLPQSTIGLILSGLEKARGALTGAYRNAQNVKAANLLTGPATPGSAQAIASGAAPANALLAPASGAILAQKSGMQVPNPLQWAQPAINALTGNIVVPPGIPHVIVRGANVASGL